MPKLSLNMRRCLGDERAGISGRENNLSKAVRLPGQLLYRNLTQFRTNKRMSGKLEAGEQRVHIVTDLTAMAKILDFTIQKRVTTHLLFCDYSGRSFESSLVYELLTLGPRTAWKIKDGIHGYMIILKLQVKCPV